MSHDKISVVILGNGKSLKKAAITNILGKDLSELCQTKILNKEIYENETCVFTCISNLGTNYEEIRGLFSKNPKPNICLMVVEDGFSSKAVWQQIDELSKNTQKDIEEFRVLLPIGYKQDDYPFKVCTSEEVLKELEKLALDKGLRLRQMRPADNSGSQNEMEMKRKHTSIKLNLVLVGMAGTGKSTSGNTILRKNAFMSRPSSKPITTECQLEETEIKGVHVRVIDTPDIFDDDIKPSVRDTHVRRCKELCESGPCVYVLVMQVSRFTDGERDILKKLGKAFGKKVKEQTVILFTQGDDLCRADISFEKFLHSCQPDLKKIVEQCGNRCVVFDNRKSDFQQMEKLLDMVYSMLKEEGQTCI